MMNDAEKIAIAQAWVNQNSAAVSSFLSAVRIIDKINGGQNAPNSNQLSAVIYRIRLLCGIDSKTDFDSLITALRLVGSWNGTKSTENLSNDISAANSLLQTLKTENAAFISALKKTLDSLPLAENHADWVLLLNQAKSQTPHNILSEMLSLIGDLMYYGADTWIDNDKTRAHQYANSAAEIKKIWGLN